MSIANTSESEESSVKLWIYLSSRLFTAEEEKWLLEKGTSFTNTWEAHGKKLLSTFLVLARGIVVIMVDESSAEATGCSIDKSVNLMKELGSEMNIDFLDRMRAAYLTENHELKICTVDEIKSAYSSGSINDDTKVFNSLIDSKDDLTEKLYIPFKDSWLSAQV